MNVRTTGLQVNILGPTSVIRDGTRVGHPDLGGPKPRQILGILAVRAGTPVPKDQIAELLWDGRPPQGYPRTLESYVCVLRRGLGLTGRGSGISTVLHGYLLDDSLIDVDLITFRHLARSGVAGAGLTDEERLSVLTRAVATVAGDLLASEPYAEWAIVERERFDVELAGVAVDAAACAMRLGRAEDAVRLAHVAIRRDPFAEEAWCALIDALAACGRGSEAIRAYHQLESMLAQELSTAPSWSTEQRYLAALRQTQEARPGHELDPHEELRLLLALVRRTVRRVPGADVVAADRGLVSLAACVGGTSS